MLQGVITLLGRLRTVLGDEDSRLVYGMWRVLDAMKTLLHGPMRTISGVERDCVGSAPKSVPPEESVRPEQR